MRILFMGGHDLGKLTLEYLIRQGRNVVGVTVTDTDDKWYKGVDEVAIKYGIPLYKEKNINNASFISLVKTLNIDVIVVVNFEQILKQDIIELPSKCCINTHASLLPKYRGRAPLNWALINGELETGVTVHYIEKGIDTGDIILQKSIEINKDEYIDDVLTKVKTIYPKIVDESIELIQNNRVNPIKQDLTKGFYCGKRTIRDGQINWQKPLDEVYNLIRAVSYPYPGAYTYYNDKKVIIWKAKIDTISKNKAQNFVNGTIFMNENNKLIVNLTDGYLIITEFEVQDNEINFEKGHAFYYKEDINV